MRRIVSYSIFGHPSSGYWRSDTTPDKFSTYVRFLPTLVRAHHAIWPGWELRLHHDDGVTAHPYWKAMRRMHDAGIVVLKSCGPAHRLTEAMLWRFLPAFEEGDACVTCYDVDAIPLLKMRRAVEEFIESGKTVHVVHDAESHDGVMGGTTSVRSKRFRGLLGVTSLAGLMSFARADWNTYAADEHYMRVTIWPKVASEGLIHRLNRKPTVLTCSDIRHVISYPIPADVLPQVGQLGDAFAPYVGSAGYEVDRAMAFYGSLPLPVMAQIAACEAV